MAINMSKVLLGGLAAGVVLNIIDGVAGATFLGERMTAESNAFKPGLGDQMMAGNAMYIYIVIDLILGILLVWTYAAIRPRFGPGVGTAVRAALLFWILGGIFYFGYLAMGMMSPGLWFTFSIVALVNLVLAAIAGAWVYKEEAPAV